ncbi:CHAT domain-containing protein [Actinokineospora sp. NPDC004072]
MPQPPADPVGLARDLHRRGKAAASANRYPEAARLLRAGVAALAAPGLDPVDALEVRTRLLITLSFCVAETRGLDEGLRQLDTARDGLGGLPPGPLREELESLVNGVQGVLLFRVGRIAEGIASVDLDVAYHERRFAASPGDPAIANSLVTTLSNRGNAYGEIHRFEEAVRDLDRAAELAERFGMPMRTAIATHALGNALQRAGDITGALRRYAVAAKIFAEVEPSLLGRLRIDQAEALISAGLAEEAARQLDSVLPALRAQRAGQDIAEAELYRAIAALHEGDLALAQRLAGAARRRLLRRGSPGWAAIAALVVLRARAQGAGRPRATLVRQVSALAAELAELQLDGHAAFAKTLAALLHVRRGEPERAAAALRAVPSSRLGPIDHQMLLRLCRAELALAQGDQRAALAQARTGLAELGRIRDRFGGLDLLSGTSAHGRELGELAIRLVLRGPDSAANARRLFTWLERTRAQLYRYDPVDATVDDEFAERLAELRVLNRALLRARLDGLPTEDLAARCAAGRQAAMQLDWTAGPGGTPRPVATADEVLARLGDRALVAIAASDGALVAVVLAGGRVRMVRLGGLAEATESARKLHADLNALAPDGLPAPLVEVVTASARREADRLDEALLRPLRGPIGDRDLVVVPTGALHVVPWGVLPTCAGRPTAVAPSATAWLSASRPDKGSGVLLVRGPDLAAAPAEIVRLAVLHHDAKVLDGEEATVDRVLSMLDGAALAHIAAHGEHEPENALFSRLELVDGALFAHEMGRLQRTPDHVVLAACELALNRVRPGDEPLGFAGALLAGGARTVIAASSRVGDRSAAAAMADYHRALTGGAAPAIALAEAVAVDPLRRPFVCVGAGD